MSGLMLLACGSCGHRWQFRRIACPACGAGDPQPVEAGGGGTVWSATVVHRAPLPEWQVEGGYGIALVTLDEGPRVMCRGPVDLAIGARVRVMVVDGLAVAEADGGH
ncbi:Zn-ribbon domain-containing OB-fold protein [Phreatobacter sp.]|uniref:Zn-ribbon domain-containing OB-fold protein n=1 Tax=Phreatobacter sp. TaxID=1966341 RepID=UPI003F704604